MPAEPMLRRWDSRRIAGESERARLVAGSHGPESTRHGSQRLVPTRDWPVPTRCRPVMTTY